MRNLLAFAFAHLLALSSVQAQTDVVMYHNDLARTGVNSKETILTPQVVSSGKFGRIGGIKVDGQVYAQPLVISNVNVPGLGASTLLIIVTEHDSVYAFDTKGMDKGNIPAQPVWKRSFLGDDHLPCPAAPCLTLTPQEVHAPNITPEIGITATPAIDEFRKILYVTAMTKEAGVVQWKLHALDLTNGHEMPGSPVRFGMFYDGTGTGNVPNPNPGPGETPTHIPFSAINQLSRAGLVLTPSGNPAVPYRDVIIAFSSFNNNQPCHGWVFAVNANDIQDLHGVWMSTPNTASGDVWMSGGAPAVDSDNNIYFTTGNGEPEFAFNADFADSVIKLNYRPQVPGLRSFGLVDYFTPYDHVNLANRDIDFGSGGVVLLPDQPGAFSHLLLTGGKKGTLYLLNRDAMGHVDPGVPDGATGLTDSPPPLIPQALSGKIPQGPRAGGTNYGWGIYGTPAYFNGKIYTGANNDYLRSIPMVNGQMDWNAGAQSDRVIALRGVTPVISANGTTNGIVWYIDPSAYAYAWNPAGPPTTTRDGPAVLYAYDANDLSKPLFQSDINKSDWAGNVTKFTVPTVANGLVFVGGRDEQGNNGQITIYGIRSGNGQQIQGKVEIFPNPAVDRINVRVTDMNLGFAVASVYSLDGKQLIERDVNFANTATPGQIWFDIHDLPSGTYLLFITDGKQKITRKFVKVR